MKKKEKLLIELQEFFEKEGRLPSRTKESKLYQRMWKSKDSEILKFLEEHRKTDLLSILKEFFREKGRLPSSKEPKLYNRMYHSRDPEVIEFRREHGGMKNDTRPLLPLLEEFLREEGRLPSQIKERNLYARMMSSKDPKVRKFWKEHRKKYNTRPLLPTLKDFFREEGRLPSRTKERKLYHRMIKSKNPEVKKFVNLIRLLGLNLKE